MHEPKLFKHLTALYNEYAITAHDGVFTGSQREVFDKLELSNAYNPILHRALREMGCIEMIQRGAGPKPTILKLIQSPQIEQFREWNKTADGERSLTPRVSLDTVRQEIRLVERRLPEGIDLPKWILGVEGRLQRIEDHVFGDGDNG